MLSDVPKTVSVIMTVRNDADGCAVTLASLAKQTQEPDEILLVSLFNPVGAIITDSVGIGTILDDDGPIISIADANVDENLGPLAFTLTLDQTVGSDVTVAASVPC